MKSKLKYIDLFAGCGGLSLGLHNSNAWEGVFAIEKNQDAFKTLHHNLIESKNHFNWPNWLPVGNCDINRVLREYKLQLQNLRNQVDLITGGPPCQGFSSAGRRNENDSRNKLIKSYIRFIRIVQPKIIFFENVKGFTQKFKNNKDKGLKYSNYVESQLKKNSVYYDSIGYDVHGELVNFADYGVPQKRTRFILIGFRKDLNYGNPSDFFKNLEKEKFKFLKEKGINVTITLSQAISDLNSKKKIKYPFNKNFKTTKYTKVKSNYQKLMKGKVKSTIPNSHRLANHKAETIRKFEIMLSESERNKSISMELKNKLDIKKHTTIPTSSDKPCPSLTTLPDDFIHFDNGRIFTVREYARIQSFNDWYEFKGKYTSGGKRRINDVPRYSQIGNAIPPLFGEQAGLIINNIIAK